MPMTTITRCLNKSMFKNIIMDLIQLRSGSSPERSYFMLKNTELSMSKIREKYCNMLYRCYSENNHESHPWNEGSTVCDEWMEPDHGFERFAEWCQQNYYTIDGEGTMELDKDILVKGNKVYSPDTCVFAPKKINSMFGGSAKKSDNDLPKGVQFAKRKQQYYPVLIGLDGKRLSCKERYDTVQEAWRAYATHRKDYINAVADTYHADIPEKLYIAMKNWQLSIDD